MSSGPIAYQAADGTWCYRLSAFGGCMRDIVAARKGIVPMPPSGEEDPWLEEGHLHEEDVVRKLTAAGDQVTDRQGRVELEVPPGMIVGHLDGRIDGGILEVKAPGKNVFAEVEAMGVEAWVKHHPQYSWQVSGAMWATGSKAKVVVKSRDSGKILDAEISIPPKSMDDFQARMDEIEKWVEVDRLPPCEKSAWCWKGPYRHVHYKDTDPKDPIPIHETRNTAMEQLTDKLEDVRRKKRAIEQQEDELKEELLAMFGDGIYVTDHHKVSIREVNTTRMDQKRVRADHGDEYDVEVSYRTIRIDPRS